MSDVEKIVNEWVSDRQATHNLSCEMVYGPKTPLFFTVDGSYPGPFLTGPPITIYKVHVDCPHSIALQIHFSLPAKARLLSLTLEFRERDENGTESERECNQDLCSVHHVPRTCRKRACNSSLSFSGILYMNK